MKLKVTAGIRTGMGSKLSEHTGHCQGCGRKQMLPGGMLSKHGYTVQWQMFMGICPGSGRLPYEVSCDYIKECIVNTREKRIPQAEGFISKLESDPITNNVSEVSIYDKAKYKYIKLYHVEIYWEPNPPESNFGRGAICVKDKDGKVYVYNRNPVAPGKEEEAIHNLAVQFRKAELRHAQEYLASLHDYIRWQQKRVDDWKLVDLTKIERDPQQQTLNRLELGLLKQISDKCDQKGYYGINSRTKFVNSNKVTFGRVVKLADRGYLNTLERGYNSDGEFIKVTMTEKGKEAISAGV
jgi:hypothetical protein